MISLLFGMFICIPNKRAIMQASIRVGNTFEGDVIEVWS